ncbi:MAG: orotidine-5'-phosphate decarboxylase [Armatimonadetes bacterium]|nr:orotidine-5'-phosphate decarboxylase [Armatimonadota bacterium]
MEPKDRIIVALDTSDRGTALRWAEQLAGSVGAVKVGLELVNAAGIGVLDDLRAAGCGRIFYDAKLHDIPNTVAGACRPIGRRGLWMTNVHACGGSRMIKAAASALAEGASDAGCEAPLLVAVTLLTSLSPQEATEELLLNLPPADYVPAMARLARDAGAQGVVASPKEIEAIRWACGHDILIVTPGVRPAWADAGDQRRTATPAEAVRTGADYLVIGRPITGATNPAEAAARIADEIAQG